MKSVQLLICYFTASLVVSGSARKVSFEKLRFETAVSKALKSVQQILDTTREPRLLEYENHQYDDKYALAEFMTNMAIVSNLQVLEQLGLKDDLIQSTLLPLVHKEKRSVRMRFQSEDSCTFVKEHDVEIPSTQHSVKSTTMEEDDDEDEDEEVINWFSSGRRNNKRKETTKTSKTRIISTIKEYHWNVSTSYKVVILVNNNDTATSTSSLELASHKASAIIKISGGSGTTRRAPIAAKTIHDPIDVDLTWLLRQIISTTTPSATSDYEVRHKENKDNSTETTTTTASSTAQFTIHRFATIQQQQQQHEENITKTTTKPISTCKTPRRNKDVEQALQFNRELFAWAQGVKSHFKVYLEQFIMGRHRPVLQEQEDKDPLPELSWVETEARNNLFIPILPIMEHHTRLLSGQDMELFWNHHKTTMKETIQKVSNAYYNNNNNNNNTTTKAVSLLLTNQEAIMVLLCEHITKLAKQYQDGMNYLEYLLEQQLIQAIGKELGPEDLEEYMKFHAPKLLFDKAYIPTPFSYAVRRSSDHFPDGTISIMQSSNNNKNEPIETFVRHFPGTGETTSSPSSIFIPMNAATSIEITGDRYLHGWIQYRWEHQQEEQQQQQQFYQLTARANQFSSFLLVIGTMGGPDTFLPKHAILLQNKDEVMIKLITNVLPSAKEFKDAILSLSPEQQQFARAFREMQLESSVFGICIIQIKPQLEKLLGLPRGALTKEIQLTQDLMSLFIDYQIPSDLLSYDGSDANDDVSTKVDEVKNYTKAVMNVIDNAKKKQLEEEEQRANMKKMKASSSSRKPSAAPSASSGPSAAPSAAPSVSPSASSAPSAAPSTSPSVSSAPSAAPSVSPSLSSAPSSAPAVSPSLSESSTTATTTKTTTATTTATTTTTTTTTTTKTREERQEHGRQQQQHQARGGEDFTLLPKILDQKLEKYDAEGSVRSTILKTCENTNNDGVVNDCWSRIRQENLLLPPQRTDGLSDATIESEKNNAFDLLVAISRSGSLPIDHSELHVIVAVSHCFEKDIMSTIIQDNVNPIEKVEKAMLLVASAIFHGWEGREGGGEEETAEAVRKLIRDDQAVERLTQSFPLLFNISNFTKKK